MSVQPEPPPGTFAPLPRRPLIALALMALVVAGSILLWLYIVYFRQKQPTPVYARIGKPIPLSVYRKGHNAYLTLQTVGSTGTPPHPDRSRTTRGPRRGSGSTAPCCACPRTRSCT